MMAENPAARTGRDTLSKLSDELLLVIISLLPMEEAVRTSVLSQRWRYLYASRSDLEFDFSIPSVPIDVMNVVDRVFFYRKSSPIQKFLFRCSKLGAIDPCRLEGWIKCVLCYDVREICLSIHSGLVLPSNLFTCETLVELSLNLSTGPLIEVPANVFLPCLKTLYLLSAISFHKDGDCVERLLSNCPALENLVCFIGDNECRLIVSNPSLKDLKVIDDRRSISEGVGSFEISINAPNLVSLFYYVFDVDSHRSINMQSLNEATVSFFHRQGGNLVNYALAAADFIRGISCVRKLSIDGRFLYDLVRLNIPIPVFPNTTEMDIADDAVDSFADLLHILTFFEALEYVSFGTPMEFDLDGGRYAPEEIRASCLSFRLKKIYFSQFTGETCRMKMVEYFLENAKVLEVLEIDMYGRDCEEELEINKELLMFPRASEKCKVVVTSRPIGEGNAQVSSS